MFGMSGHIQSGSIPTATLKCSPFGNLMPWHVRQHSQNMMYMMLQNVFSKHQHEVKPQFCKICLVLFHWRNTGGLIFKLDVVEGNIFCKRWILWDTRITDNRLHKPQRIKGGGHTTAQRMFIVAILYTTHSIHKKKIHIGDSNPL